MTKPCVTNGEDENPHIGGSRPASSRRFRCQTTSPVKGLSRFKIPLAPSANRLPLAIVGVPRGPRHQSFPKILIHPHEPRLAHRFSRCNMRRLRYRLAAPGCNSRSPATAKDDQPGPIFVRQISLGGCCFQSSSIDTPGMTPSRLGSAKLRATPGLRSESEFGSLASSLSGSSGFSVSKKRSSGVGCHRQR